MEESCSRHGLTVTTRCCRNGICSVRRDNLCIHCESMRNSIKKSQGTVSLYSHLYRVPWTKISQCTDDSSAGCEAGTTGKASIARLVSLRRCRTVIGGTILVLLRRGKARARCIHVRSSIHRCTIRCWGIGCSEVTCIGRRASS